MNSETKSETWIDFDYSNAICNGNLCISNEFEYKIIKFVEISTENRKQENKKCRDFVVVCEHDLYALSDTKCIAIAILSNGFAK